MYLCVGKMGLIDGLWVLGIEVVGEIVEDVFGMFWVGQCVVIVMGGLQFMWYGSYVEEVIVLCSNVIDLDGIMLLWEEFVVLLQVYLMIWGVLYCSFGIEVGQMLLVCGVMLIVGFVVVIYVKVVGFYVVVMMCLVKNEECLVWVGVDKVVVDFGMIVDDVQCFYFEGIDVVFEIVGVLILCDIVKMLYLFGVVMVIGLFGGLFVFEQFNLMVDLLFVVWLSFFLSQLFGMLVLLFDNVLLWMIVDDIVGKCLFLLFE